MLCVARPGLDVKYSRMLVPDESSDHSSASADHSASLLICCDTSNILIGISTRAFRLCKDQLTGAQLAVMRSVAPHIERAVSMRAHEDIERYEIMVLQIRTVDLWLLKGLGDGETSDLGDPNQAQK